LKPQTYFCNCWIAALISSGALMTWSEDMKCILADSSCFLSYTGWGRFGSKNQHRWGTFAKITEKFKKMLTQSEGLHILDVKLDP